MPVQAAVAVAPGLASASGLCRYVSLCLDDAARTFMASAAKTSVGVAGSEPTPKEGARGALHGF